MKILLIFVDKRHINAVLSDILAQIRRHRTPKNAEFCRKITICALQTTSYVLGNVNTA